MSVPKKPSLIVSFVRSQMVAIIATAVDFIVTIGLKEFLLLGYQTAVIIGAVCGGITGFLLGKYWAFVSLEAKTAVQALKYFPVMGASILLNFGGVVLLVDHLGIQYIIAKAIIATAIGIAFNFTLHRYYVFK